jgi:hypothetical protein
MSQQRTHRLIGLALATLGMLLLAACGGGGGGGGTAAPTASDNANLAALEVDGGLDQIFQSSLLSYTSDVGFLATTLRMSPRADDDAASITVNGTPVASGQASAPIPLSVGGNTLTIEVTARDASTTQTYTVAVTRASATSFAEAAYIKASNTDDRDELGWQVAVSGDTLAVGAPFEDGGASGINGNEGNAFPTTTPVTGPGAVYVFTRSGTTWVQEAYIKASNIAGLGTMVPPGDRFGTALALDGDTLVVGAPFQDGDGVGVNGAEGSGAAYVFVRTGTTWSQQAYLKASNTGADDQFGSDVDVHGDTIVVGAPRESSDATGIDGAQDNDDATQSGAAYVFTRDGTTWSQQAFVKASNTARFDRFGWSVAIDADTLAVGAINEDSSAPGINGDQTADVSTAINNGAAYVFVRDDTSWTQQAYIKASNPGPNDAFGTVLDLSGDTLVVGAPGEGSDFADIATTTPAPAVDNNNRPGSGAVYVFTRNGTTWSQQAYVKAFNVDDNNAFGFSLAVDGDSLAVGARSESNSATGIDDLPFSSDGAAPFSGAAYTYTRVGTTWSRASYIKSSAPDINDIFGASLDLDGGTLAVGVIGEDGNSTGPVGGDPTDNSLTSSGAAFVFR